MRPNKVKQFWKEGKQLAVGWMGSPDTYMVEAMAVAGMRQGLDPNQAMMLARQTVIGAAALMEADTTPVSVLREDVTSPKGTTAAALGVRRAINPGAHDFAVTAKGYLGTTQSLSLPEQPIQLVLGDLDVSGVGGQPGGSQRPDCLGHAALPVGVRDAV